MATAMQTNVNLAKGVTPFRSAPKPSARRARMVVTQASKEPSDFAKKTAAAFAAAALTLSAPAFATEGGIMPSRNRGEDKAARAFLDSKENKGPAVQSRSADPNSGKFQNKTNPDPRDTRNAQLGGTAGANGRSVAFYNTWDLQVNVDAVQQAKDKIGEALSDVKQAGNKASNLADDAAGTAKSAAKDVKQQRNVSFDPSSLQKNVVFGVGETGTTSEQAGKAADSAAEAIGDPAQSAKNAASRAGQEAERVLSNPAGGPDQSRRAAAQLADANAAVPKALQGGAQKIKDAVTPSSFSGYDTASLQTNVVFGIGETGTTSEQAGKAADSAAEAIGDPAQSAKNAASRAGQEAERVLSNPAGGPDQSRKAASQLADANAEVPKALQGGAQKIKDAVTPSGFSGFDAAALQHSAGLEGGFNRAALQHNVRVGDLSSISGGQAKKAGPDATTNASDPGTGDAQLTTDRSTSGVKARPASGEPDSKGAAERAESRPGKLESGKISGL